MIILSDIKQPFPIPGVPFLWWPRHSLEKSNTQRPSGRRGSSTTPPRWRATPPGRPRCRGILLCVYIYIYILLLLLLRIIINNNTDNNNDNNTYYYFMVCHFMVYTYIMTSIYLSLSMYIYIYISLSLYIYIYICVYTYNTHLHTKEETASSNDDGDNVISKRCRSVLMKGYYHSLAINQPNTYSC